MAPSNPPSDNPQGETIDVAPDQVVQSDEIDRAAEAAGGEGDSATLVPGARPGTGLAMLPDDLLTELLGPELSPQDVARAIVGAADLPEQDSEAATRAIVARILMSDTAADVLDQANPIHADQLYGVPLEITDVRWQRSAFDQGSKVYAFCKGTNLNTGESIAVTCGGVNVCAQLLRLSTLPNGLPAKVRITQAQRPTASGYYPLWLEPA